MRTNVVLAFAVALGFFSTISLMHKLDKANKELNILHCQVVLYEDYSARIDTQENIRNCIAGYGYKLEWR